MWDGMRMERGSCSLIAAELMTLWMAKGPMNLGAQLLRFHLERKVDLVGGCPVTVSVGQGGVPLI